MKTRRDFIKNITFPIAVLPSICNSNSFYNKNYEGPILKIALMGLGDYAAIIADAMFDCKKAKIVGLISGTPSKLDSWSKKLNIKKENCYNYENYHNIKHNSDIDAVYIITPNALHKQMTINVARAGKHVIVEKPMALNSTECQEMITACSNSGVNFGAGSPQNSLIIVGICS